MAGASYESPTEYINHHLTFMVKQVGDTSFWSINTDTVVTSIVLVVPVVSVKLRSVEAVAPVYCKVPPPSTRFAAALLAAPRLPGTLTCGHGRWSLDLG